MDSSVIGSYPMVGRHHHHRHHHGHPAPGMPQLSDEQLAAIARAHGLMLVPLNPNQGGASAIASPVGNELLPTGQRILPAAFQKASAIAAGGAYVCTANVQRGFQVKRLIVQAVVDASGADAGGFLNITEIKVGQRTQVVSEGDLTPSLFIPNAFEVGLIFDPARTGNVITVSGTIAGTAPGACTVKASAIGWSAE